MFRISNKIGQRKPRETAGNEGRDLLFSDWNLVAVTTRDQDALQKASPVRIADRFCIEEIESQKLKNQNPEFKMCCDQVRGLTF